MDMIERIISSLDYILDTKRKHKQEVCAVAQKAVQGRTATEGNRRHIIGGVLLSTSLLFGGLAATVFTLKEGDTYE